MDPQESITTIGLDGPTATMIRRELFRLAAEEDRMAADEASSVPYWAPCPASVLGHRAAARALRLDADRFLAGPLPMGAAS